MTNPTKDIEPTKDELFELCKKVYELTGWDDYGRSDWWTNNEEVIPDRDRNPTNSICPLYTSDYLLEKLPRHLNFKKQIWHLLVMNGDVEETNWIADYVTVGRECWLHDKELAKLTEADTPLKALLKLTLALKEAGEL